MAFAAAILDILVDNFRTRDGMDKIMSDFWSEYTVVIFKIPYYHVSKNRLFWSKKNLPINSGRRKYYKEL